MTLALIDERVSERIKTRLCLLGFYPISFKKSPRLSEDVGSHPDILAFYDRGRLITSADYLEGAPWIFEDIRKMSNTSFTLSDDILKEGYPCDSIYNAVRFDNCLFCKSDSISQSVLEYAKSQGLKTVHTRQGYPNCTVLKLDERTAVTADRGMKKILSENGVRVYEISEGHIELPTRRYGFIGGAAGVYGGCVYFLGNADLHPDKDIIKGAISDCGMKYVSLSDEPLFDGGKIIFI